MPQVWQEGLLEGDCTEELFSRCRGRGHAADACPTSKEEAVLAASDDDDDDNTRRSRFQLSRPERQASVVMFSGRKREGESVRRVGDEA